MLVGEIGIPRREFLYDLTKAEIILITRGYFRRYHPGWEQARFIGYHAAHAMGSRTPPPPPSQWFPLPWENSAKPSDEEVEEMRAIIKRENEQKENGET